jgi:hypothetical protein
MKPFKILSGRVFDSTYMLMQNCAYTLCITLDIYVSAYHNELGLEGKWHVIIPSLEIKSGS